MGLVRAAACVFLFRGIARTNMAQHKFIGEILLFNG